MTTPDKYIRKAYLLAIAAQFVTDGITCPIYDMQVPKDTSPVPPLRLILSTQTKKQANTSKCGHDWNASILLDIIYEQQQGFTDRSVVDDVETSVNSAIDVEEDIDCPPFTIYNTQILDTHDMSLQTPTKSITRRLVRIQHIMGLTA